jgi:hypothetical protein
MWIQTVAYKRYFLPVQMVTMTIYSPIGITIKIYPVFTPLPCRWRFLQTAATYYETTRRHVPKDTILQRHRLKNHKSYSYNQNINKSRSGNDEMLASYWPTTPAVRSGKGWNE